MSVRRSPETRAAFPNVPNFELGVRGLVVRDARRTMKMGRPISLGSSGK